MAERNYTDEQIKEEVRGILANPNLRQCCHCVHSEKSNFTECEVLHIPISRFQYCGHCRHFLTNEEKMLLEARQAIERVEKEERKLNHILTVSLNSIECAMLFLEDFESRVEMDFKRAEAKGTGDPKVRKSDRAWMSTLTRSYKAMKKDMEGVRRHYTHFVEPLLNKVFFDKETRTYDVTSYDDHMSDTNELARILLKYFEKSYLSQENAESVEKFIDSLDGCDVLEEADYKRYNLRR